MSDEISGFGAAYQLFIRQQKNKNLSVVSTDSIEEYQSVKRALGELKGVGEWNNQIKEIYVHKETIYSALEHEIASFTKKAYIQYENILAMAHVDFIWLYVTHYYWLFYISCVLTRFNNYFVIYLDEEVAQYISDVATSFSDNSLIKINARTTYFVKIQKNDDMYGTMKVTLTTTRDQHKSNWETFKSFLINLKKDLSQQEDTTYEKIIIEKIYDIFNQNSSVFSEMRNYFNYRFEAMFEDYSLEQFEDNFVIENVAQTLNNLSNSIDKNNSGKLIATIGYYFFRMLENAKQDLQKEHT